MVLTHLIAFLFFTGAASGVAQPESALRGYRRRRRKRNLWELTADDLADDESLISQSVDFIGPGFSTDTILGGYVRMTPAGRRHIDISALSRDKAALDRVLEIVIEREREDVMLLM